MPTQTERGSESEGWYEGPFDVHPCAEFPREIVRWECPRHGMLDAATEQGCFLCSPSRRLKPRRIVFKAVGD